MGVDTTSISPNARIRTTDLVTVLYAHPRGLPETHHPSAQRGDNGRKLDPSPRAVALLSVDAPDEVAVGKHSEYQGKPAPPSNIHRRALLSPHDPPLPGEPKAGRGTGAPWEFPPH